MSALSPDNQFDNMLARASAPDPEASSAAGQNPFDALIQGGSKPDGSSAAGAFARSAARNVVPAAGGLAGAASGAEIGAIAGAAIPVAGETGLGEVGGAIVGGLIGGFGGGFGADKAQDYAISQLPDSWRDPLERSAQEDEANHPTASFLGGLVPFAATMTPFSAASKLPANATAMQRIMANPVTARLFGGVVQGGIEGGQEIASGDPLDWRRVAISTGFGVVFNRPNALGTRIEEIGTSPVQRLFGRAGPGVAVPQEREADIPQVQPDEGIRGRQDYGEDFEGLHDALTAPPTKPSNDNDILGLNAPTIFKAGDMRVLGSGVTEEVFLGSHEQDPYAAMVAQDQARTEEAVFIAPPAPDVSVAARRIEPDLFHYYESALARRDALQRQVDEMGDGGASPDATEAARQRLAEVDKAVEEMAPQIAAANRRAAEQTGTQIVPTTPVEPTSGIAGPSITAQMEFIKADLTRRLIAVGRPADEAEASAAVIASKYTARALRMKGAIGSPQEAYLREHPEIRGSDGKSVPTSRPPPVRPTKPSTLLAFIKRGGGIKDEGGELNAMDLVRGYPGLVNNKRGMSLDMARRAAAEAGYLGHDINGAMANTTVADFLDAVAAHPRFSVKDEAEVYGNAEKAAHVIFHDRVESEAQAIDAWLKEAGEKPIDKEWRSEAAQLIVHGEETSIDNAIERAAIMLYERDVEQARSHRDGTLSPDIDHEVPFSADEDSLRGDKGSGEGERPGSQGDAGTAQEPVRDVDSTLEEAGARGEGLEEAQYEFWQGAQGKIRISPGQRSIITLMKTANASTFMHESAHDWLEQLLKDAGHEAAPDEVKGDASVTREWLGMKEGDKGPTTKQHEKFANGFEQYLREGAAPSRELAGVFAKFANWLTGIYKTIKGLGAEISPDIRGVFDRLLSAEPQHTVIGPETERAKTLADIHETDAAETPPKEADAVADRVAAERQRHAADVPEGIVHEVQVSAPGTESAGENGEGPSGGGSLGRDRGRPEDIAGSGGMGVQPGAERAGGSVAKTESGGVQRSAGSGPDAATSSKSGYPDPRPTTLFGPDETGIIDKAGNIRLDKFNADTDVKQVIRDAADANQDFIGDRQGVITDGQVMQLADALGMDFSTLGKRKIGEAFNAVQIQAARKLLITSATNVHELMRKAAIGTDEDVAAYAEAKDRHQMIQAQVAGITAEAGRALRAFKARIGEGEGQAMAVNQFIKNATGKTLFQLREEAKLGSALDTPEKVSKMMVDARKRSFGDMILEYWINGLISGPATHTTYMVGNTILAALKAGPETLAAAAIGKARETIGQERPRVYAGESGAQFKGLVKSIPSALQAAAESFRAGVTTNLPGEKGFNELFRQDSGVAQAPDLNQGATYHDAAAAAFGIVRGTRDAMLAGAALLKAGGIAGEPVFGRRYSPLGTIPDFTYKGVSVAPLGQAVRLPGRFIAAIHSFFRAMNYSMEKSALAYRQAAGEGLDSGAFADRVGDLWQNPSEDIMKGASESATQLTLMGQGGEFTQALSKLTNARVFGIKLGKFIDPFVHISSNIIEQSIIARTPVGILSPEIRADLTGKNGSIAQDKAMARMLVGTALGVTFGGLAASGYASGSGPSDPRQAAIWRLAGNQAHSVRIGDLWYDVHRLGPMGMLMGVAADMYEVAHTASQGDMLLAGSTLQHALTQNILDESFMRGPADLIKAVEDPGRYGEAYLRNWASSFIPYSVGMAQMARASDPYSRQARTVMDAIKAKIPTESETLFPRRDVWGEPMRNPDALVESGVTAIYETRMSRDPVNLAMLSLGVAPATIERKIRNVDLDDQQYDDFARLAGRMTKQRLDTVVNSPDWQSWPSNVQHDVISEVIKQSREAARGMMMMKYPAIASQATQAKQKKASGQ